MNVELLYYTPEPERAVALAGRLCYSPSGLGELAARLDEASARGFVRRLAAMGHLSTFEHASFTFAAEGISRVLTHQLVRHRIASYSQQSQRYVFEGDFAAITPLSVENNPAAKQKFHLLMDEIQKTYNELTALGIDKEDARYVLPNAAGTRIIITMNARSLLNFFQLRCCLRAQWEIRRLAEGMLGKARAVAPALFEKAGPSCVAERVCREGEKTCGRLAALLKEDGARDGR
ncbi:MAG: FAD-dependent thymidylate synthase [Acidaminococcales bacterium]|jgi:thymidylate synthase (FAD)|nr:FAD-dependent thymidylate synthase [Acidaminococcales bacterium]